MVLLNGASVLESGAQLVAQMGERYTGDRRATSWTLAANRLTVSKTLYLQLDTGSTQEGRKSSQHDLKIVDRGCKASNQINKNILCLCGLSLTLILWHLIWVYNVC